MSETATKAVLLSLLAARKHIPLSGNKESFSYIEREGLFWIMVQGDPMVPNEKDRSQISDDYVLTSVLWYVRDKLGVYGPNRGEVTWEQVLAYYRDGGY